MSQLNEPCNSTAIPPYIEPLTERESHVMEQLRTGITVREIAAVMGVSVNTTKHHLRNIYAKLGVRSRSAALNSHRFERSV
ncbi:MAG TPA: helix-turn-helix transcriptional regulator [Solimonas sp.]|nr:helix-turn-helix transcriptional regulator [Solimonas sp.]